MRHMTLVLMRREAEVASYLHVQLFQLSFEKPVVDADDNNNDGMMSKEDPKGP